MTELDRDRVDAEFARWRWIPPAATVVGTDDVEFYLSGEVAHVLRAPERADPRDSVAVTRAVAHEHGADSLSWRLPPEPRPPGIVTALVAAGAELTDRQDRAALDLSAGPPEVPVPSDVDAHEVRTRADVEAAMTAAYAVWGGVEPTEDAVDARYAEPVDGWFVAYHQGRPAGSGGYTLAGTTARLWGSGVLPGLRGRGAYRGLVAARLRAAVERGADLAITNASTTTSAPVLRRLGFTGFGEARVYRLPCRV